MFWNGTNQRIFSCFNILGYVLQIMGTSIVPLTPHIPSDTSFSRKLCGASGCHVYIYIYTVSIIYSSKETHFSLKKNMTGFTHNCLAGLVGSVLFPRGAFLHRRGLSFSGGAVSWGDLKVKFLCQKTSPSNAIAFPASRKKTSYSNGFSYGWFIRIGFVQWWILKMHRCFVSLPSTQYHGHLFDSHHIIRDVGALLRNHMVHWPAAFCCWFFSY